MNQKSGQSMPEIKQKEKTGAEVTRNVKGGRFKSLYQVQNSEQLQYTLAIIDQIETFNYFTYLHLKAILKP